MTLRQLSGLDAAFLTLETPRSPMLVGGVSILGPRPGKPPLDVATLRALLAGRLTKAVALRRRLASLPLELTRPYWVELDPDQIDLTIHVEATELPEPGGWRELSALFAWELGQQLDRSRPLWQLTLAHGLVLPDHPPGTVALIGKVHHAAIDGVSGAEILGVLFDAADSPESADAADPAELANDRPGGRRRPPSASTKQPASAGAAPAAAAEPDVDEPGVLELLAQTGRDLAAAPQKLTSVVARSLLGLAAGSAARARSQLRRVVGDESADAPPLPFTAPVSVFNHPLDGALAWAPARLDLSRIKAIKSATQSTVNDVVLSVCAGALRGWLAGRNELPEAPLVAMVPVSVRADSERAQAGNLVSAMLVSLATDRSDPLERLTAIRDAARSSKVAHQAVGARTLLSSADLVPFGLSGLAVRLYSRLQLADRHRPIFNLVITNVPGPQRPLAIAGAPLLAHFGAAPLFDGLGLLLTVMSYAGTMTVGITADRTMMATPAELATRIELSLDELTAAVVG